MIIRRTRDSVFLEMAAILAKRGTCNRKQVGAIVTRDGRAVSWGYNGAPPGLPHCEENEHGWAVTKGERWIGEYKELVENHGCRNATHAEANALAFAARQGTSTDGGTLYVSVSPCEVCARLLIAAGIKRVVYAEEYRDRGGIDTLTAAGVTCCDGARTGGLARPAGPATRVH